MHKLVVTFVIKGYPLCNMTLLVELPHNKKPLR